MMYEVIRFTKKGERSKLTFDAEPMDDGSIVLQVKFSEKGTDVNLADHIPKEDIADYFPVYGFRFYRKESAICLKKACEGIIKWFEKQEQDGGAE